MISDQKDIVPHLRYWGEKVREHRGRIVPSFLIQAADEIERLRAERDEARRMYCEEAFCHRFDERRFNERCVPSPISNARQIAHNMKWDCFKENTND